MDYFKNIFGLQLIIGLIPGALTSLGMSLKNKDDNTTGFDDAGGNVLIALAPVVPAFIAGNEPILKKTLLAAYNTIGGYLGFPPAALQSANPLTMDRS